MCRTARKIVTNKHTPSSCWHFHFHQMLCFIHLPACMPMPSLHGRFAVSCQAGLASEVTQEPAQQSACLPSVRGWARLNWHLNPYQTTAANSTQDFSNSPFQKKKKKPTSPAKIPSWPANMCRHTPLCCKWNIWCITKPHWRSQLEQSRASTGRRCLSCWI